jgi:hypothetical protein
MSYFIVNMKISKSDITLSDFFQNKLIYTLKLMHSHGGSEMQDMRIQDKIQ